ncbi:PREDICTED: putative B3 domain-containing protein REM15 [Tarenaya hassleriana]|uniref:putative B3 domain-containing protein REM15 n=1 Tax=Tarenaya hassleriana TaxID=28532 RepID=UPI00053C7DAE|nr:PREDICTED: putative B3 domain-containing protein REM15 [Tarenaya hassleriana]
MANPKASSPSKPHFFQPLLPGYHLHLNIPVTFFKKNIEGKHENKGATLISDVSHRTWKVKLDGRRFTDGWKDFADDHDFRTGDFVVFRHEGDLVFHVTGFGPSCCNLQYAPFSLDDDDREDNAIKNRSSKEKKSSEGGPKEKERVPSPRANPSVTLTLKPNSLTKGLRFPIHFTRQNFIVKPGKVTLLDKNGGELSSNFFSERDGTMRLGICGLRGFFGANAVKEGESFTLELIRRDTTPVLKFCSKTHQHQNRAAAESPIPNKTQTRKRVRIGGPILDPVGEKESKHREHGSMDVTSSIGSKENSCRAQTFSDADNELAEAKHETVNTLGQFPDVPAKEEENPVVLSQKPDDFGNLPKKKKMKRGPKTEAESSPDHPCFVVSVTDSGLHRDIGFLPMKFKRSIFLENLSCEIVLMDDHGRSWPSNLRITKSFSRAYINGGWKRFCQENRLRGGDSCTFKLVQNGTKTVLRLSPKECSSSKEECSKAKVEKGHSKKQSSKENSQSGECSKSEEEKQTRLRRRVSPPSSRNCFVTLTLKNFVRGYVRLPKKFTRENGIDKPGMMTLLDKDGVEWLTNYWMEKSNRRMHLGKGSRAFFRANGVAKDDSFVLELIWRDKTPILKFFSKIDRSEESLVQKNILTRKRVRDGGHVLDPARGKRSKHQENGPMGSSSSSRGTAETSRRSQSLSASNQVAKAEQKVPEVPVKEEQNQRASLCESDAFVNLLRKKRVDGNPKIEAESSEDHSCFVARVTPANLRKDELYLPKSFIRSNGLENRCCEILLMNEQGIWWESILRSRKDNGRVHIYGGWRSFCCANGQKPDSFCTFKLVLGGTKLALLRLPSTGSDGNSISKTCTESIEKKAVDANTRTREKNPKRKEKTRIMQRASSDSSPCRNPFVALTPTPKCVGRLRLPIPFTRENRIEPGQIILVGRGGAKWPINLMKENKRPQMSLGKGWREFREANGLKPNVTFVLELIWQGSIPLLKLCSHV